MVAVEVENVTKRFRRQTVQPSTTLKTAFMDFLLQRRRRQLQIDGRGLTSQHLDAGPLDGCEALQLRREPVGANAQRDAIEAAIVGHSHEGIPRGFEDCGYRDARKHRARRIRHCSSYRRFLRVHERRQHQDRADQNQPSDTQSH